MWHPLVDPKKEVNLTQFLPKSEVCSCGLIKLLSIRGVAYVFFCVRKLSLSQEGDGPALSPPNASLTTFHFCDQPNLIYLYYFADGHKIDLLSTKCT